MNKSTINVPSAGTETDSSTTAQNQQVSQTNANTNVVGSLVGQREIKFKFWLGHIKKMTYEHNLIEIAHMFWDFNEEIIPLQYTGLKDKNGKEIYEGDIIKSTAYPNSKMKVVFLNGSFRATGRHLMLINVLLYRLDNPEVIGNIFENPELLEAAR